VHIVTNETIDGIELGDPDVGEAVLVSDMTSTLLSRCAPMRCSHTSEACCTTRGQEAARRLT
jgi:phosphoserine aminotransferase